MTDFGSMFDYTSWWNVFAPVTKSYLICVCRLQLHKGYLLRPLLLNKVKIKNPSYKRNNSSHSNINNINNTNNSSNNRFNKITNRKDNNMPPTSQLLTLQIQVPPLVPTMKPGKSHVKIFSWFDSIHSRIIESCNIIDVPSLSWYE